MWNTLTREETPASGTEGIVDNGPHCLNAVSMAPDTREAFTSSHCSRIDNPVWKSVSLAWMMWSRLPGGGPSTDWPECVLPRGPLEAEVLPSQA
eukprot:CAMPEP_0170639266 /NCGR_PEP_ID=MMETSP0224-20130122/39550_1 /TAXON_ID=285029 /ORGANISM="Togula jolla, Strain CCCM 725" /LENGTH=93 /DNA_ID=CAMNT_0010969595 /DNA_START=267 /DNA_END=544 /DNA_ORIENTATION=+